jgi:hypothetical protein
MTKITVQIGDDIHEVGVVYGPLEPALVAAMVRDWADGFEEDGE